MADNLSLAQILRAQAEEQMKKSKNRVKSTTLLAEVVEFVNSNKSYSTELGEKHPQITVSRVKQLIKGNSVLEGKVFPIMHDDKLTLVNVIAANAQTA